MQHATVKFFFIKKKGKRAPVFYFIFLLKKYKNQENGRNSLFLKFLIKKKKMGGIFQFSIFKKIKKLKTESFPFSPNVLIFVNNPKYAYFGKYIFFCNI